MALTNATTLADYSSGIGTQGATLKVDANNQRVGIGTLTPAETLDVVGNMAVEGDISVTGTISYEDLTNVDAIGYSTFRSGVDIQGAGSTTTTLNVTGFSTFVGIVTFSSNSYFSNNVFVDGVTTIRGSVDSQLRIQDSNSTGDSSETGIEFIDSAGTIQGRIGVISGSNDDFHLGSVQSGGRIIFQSSNFQTRLILDGDGHLVPNGDGLYDLGLTGTRFRNVYADTVYGDGSNLTGVSGYNDLDNALFG